jgi:hypothetical protein
MKNSRKLLLSLAIAAALGTAGIAAHAFPGGGPGWGSGGPGMGYGPRGGGMPYHGMMGGGPRGFGPGAAMGPRGVGPGAAGASGFSVDARLAALKTELKITGNQESAWGGYAKQVKQQFESRQALFAKAPPAAPSAPERMTQRAEFAKTRAANMETMSGAVKNLYAALTTEQKTLADQHLAGGGRGRSGGRGPWR